MRLKNEKTLCIVFLSLICLIVCSCGGDGEIVNFIGSEPPDGGEIPFYGELKLNFDQPPLSVTVNGHDVYVEGATILLDSHDLYLIGGQTKCFFAIGTSATFTIAWTNRDGSSGPGAKITLRVVKGYVDIGPPSIVWASVKNGDEDVAPELLNAEGITIRFNICVRQGTIDIRPKGEDALGWMPSWGEDSVTIKPPEGKGPVHHATYIIEGLAKDEVGNTIKIDITFATKDE